MKLVRFGAKGAEKPGLIDGNGTIRDLSDTVSDFLGDAVGLTALDRIRAIDPAGLAEVDPSTRIGAAPGVGMGRNPKVWLKPGDEMHLTVGGLGDQRQKVVAGW